MHCIVKQLRRPIRTCVHERRLAENMMAQELIEIGECSNCSRCTGLARVTWPYHWASIARPTSLGCCGKHYSYRRVLSPAIQRPVVRWRHTDLLATCFHAGVMFGLFDPEDGGDMFHRKVGRLSRLFGVLSQKTVLYITTDVRTSNCYYFCYYYYYYYINWYYKLV
jgi:hypothetical protein